MIEFGRVAGSYGVRGWVKVAVDEPAVLAARPIWWLQGTAFAVEETPDVAEKKDGSNESSVAPVEGKPADDNPTEPAVPGPVPEPEPNDIDPNDSPGPGVGPQPVPRK